jgi:DNA end-binding protein Ku
MALRALASLSLNFGLVTIPVKLYAATEHAAAVRFKLMSSTGAKLRQRYETAALPERPVRWADEPPEPSPPAPVAAAPRRVEREAPAADQLAELPRSRSDQEVVGATVDRHEIAKGYEYEKGKFVLFSGAELAALRTPPRDGIDIVAFIPSTAVDPLYLDKAYLLAPDRRGERSYALLLRALQHSRRSALARWAWKGKGHIAQIRPADGGLVLQQLFYADEVRTPSVLGLALAPVDETAMALALQVIEQGARDTYDPHEFVDEEKQRILDAVERKIAGRRTVSHVQAHADAPAPPSAEVVDLLDALRASLRKPPAARAALPPRKPVVRAKPAEATASTRRAKSR